MEIRLKILDDNGDEKEAKMESVKLNKKTGEIEIGTATVRSGQKQYSILLRGHTTQDYDVEPYCLVTVTPEVAAEWLQRLDALRLIPGVGWGSFRSASGQWFNNSAEFVPQEDDVGAMMDEVFGHGDPVLLDTLQAECVGNIVRDREFRADSEELHLVVEMQPKMRKHEGACFATFEKHCDVLISTNMIYRRDLEKMAGKLYKKPRSK